MELVKLFGLLRSDGIFPSAVTLGQYTRALAEGYSKRSIGTPGEDVAGIDVSEPTKVESKLGARGTETMEPGVFLCSLDGNLTNIEEAGRRWRLKSSNERDINANVHDEVLPTKDSHDVERQKKRSSKPWLPVSTSSSFVPGLSDDTIPPQNAQLEKESIRLLAIWSRTRSCECKLLCSCAYFYCFFSLIQRHEQPVGMYHWMRR